MQGYPQWRQRSFAIAVLLLVVALTQVNARGGMVSTNQACYEYDEDILVEFRILDPAEDDWIGIYPNGMVSGDYEPSMWLWSCGTQGCWGKTNMGQLAFGGGGVSVDYIDEWPLDPGSYVAVLARNADDDGSYYEIYAHSDVFEVQRSTGYCGTHPPTQDPSSPTAIPTVNPTPHPTYLIPTRAPATPGPTASPTSSPTQGPTAPPTQGPTSPPTQAPTTPPTAAPTTTPTAAPTTAPISYTAAPSTTTTQQPTLPPASTTEGTDMAWIIAAAKTDIAHLILQDRSLAALFLRMVFHDCIGGCDGCINLSNPDNGRLDLAMDILAPIVSDYEPQGLSRPDIWVLASFVGVEMSMPDNGFLAMPFETIGRQPCDAADSTQGPNPDVCSSNLDTNGLLAFFRDHFGFSPRETAAIMGAHTIGVMHRDFQGFDGWNGWTVDNQVFNNGYYLELVGPGTEQQSQVNLAPNWQQKFIDNSYMDDVPNVFQWEGFPHGQKIVMLNADIALVRQLHTGNKAPNGKVACQFVPRGGSNTPCPMARADLFTEMVRYRNDNQAFLEDFRNALVKMTQNGYSVDDNTCDSNGICRLIKN